MGGMTRQEFYDKYKEVDFTFESYYKYTFNFVGEYEGKTVMIGVGGGSGDIYRFEVTVGCSESIESLQPYEGVCGEDSFYDYC